eukprot:TRINITY_DN19469_c0_g1_i1.p2 TRINITY_DN19469_c0_g1~~TRINITY_DN19469_c0_g1_i1.p2  ORF type:complete len:209 (+),score=31.74 TRINITY_DN19469_c0_g1_i1:75-701(+)
MQNSWVEKNIGAGTNQYTIKNQLIGEGQYAKVYFAYKCDGPIQQLIAAKVIDKNNCAKTSQNSDEKNLKTQRMIKQLRREAEIQQKFNNPYILRLNYVGETINNVYFFLDYCMDGDLQKYLMQHQPYLSESEALSIFEQISLAFQYLSADNICHRDLKPANIMIHNNLIKISDFGFSKVFDENILVNTRVGTPYYCLLYTSPSPRDQA